MMYINSSFLELFVPVDRVGLVYTAAALLAIVALSQISALLRRFGHFAVTMSIIVLSGLSILGMVFVSPAFLVIGFFLIHEVLYIALRGNADIYLEEYSKNENTGTVRGVYLTVINLSIALSPLAVSFLLSDGDYWKIYLIAFAFVLATTLIAGWKVREIPDIEYAKAPFWKTLVEVWHNTDIKSIFMTTFLMQFFFSWMVIYMPIYLHETIGFGWDQIGLMFSIMLLPYVLFELPLGKIADSIMGEKEILTAGFIIMAIPTAIMPFVSAPSFALWTTLLFISRIGASFVEIMSETYFFKKVDAGNTNTIEFFRDSRPVAYVIAPLLATLFLMFFEVRFLFLALAVVIFSGVYFASRIHDTR